MSKAPDIIYTSELTVDNMLELVNTIERLKEDIQHANKLINKYLELLRNYYVLLDISKLEGNKAVIDYSLLKSTHEKAEQILVNIVTEGGIIKYKENQNENN